MTAKISVIMATYNRAKLITEAIASVYAQNYPDLQLIVVDDGSTDNTVEVLQPWLGRDDFIFLQQANQGQPAAQNLALTRATGDFICFLDSDNIWLPGKLERQLAFMAEHPDVDILYGDLITIDGEGRETGRHNMPRYSGRIYRELLKDNCVSGNTAMMRRHCLERCGPFDASVRVAADFEMWLRYSPHCTFHYLPEFFAKYRVFPDQVSSDKERRFNSVRTSMTKFFSANPNLLPVAERQKIWAAFYARWAYYRAKGGKLQLAIAAALQSIRCYPWQKAGWRNLVLAPLLAWRAPR